MLCVCEQSEAGALECFQDYYICVTQMLGLRQQTAPSIMHVMLRLNTFVILSPAEDCDGDGKNLIRVKVLNLSPNKDTDDNNFAGLSDSEACRAVNSGAPVNVYTTMLTGISTTCNAFQLGTRH